MAFPIPSPFVWDASFDVGSDKINDQVRFTIVSKLCCPNKEVCDPLQHKKLFTLITDLEADQGNAGKLTVGAETRYPGGLHYDIVSELLTPILIHCRPLSILL